MKKFLILMVSVCLSLCAFAAPVIADANIGLIINGEEMKWDEANYGKIFMDEKENRTLIPLRIISDLLGFEVIWDSVTRTAIVSDSVQSYYFPIGQAKIITPVGVIPLDVPNRIYNGRTYLPIRAFFETFGAKVDWKSRKIASELFQLDISSLQSKNYVIVSAAKETPPTTSASETSVPAASEAYVPVTSEASYTTETTTEYTTTAPNNGGFPLSKREQEIKEQLLTYQSSHPEGLPWTNDNHYAWNNILTGVGQYNGYGCVAFAFEMSDKVFSPNEKAVRYNDVSNIREKIRVGDILRINLDTHSVIVIDRTEDGVVIAEGNYNFSVHWGRELSYEVLENITNHYYTRHGSNPDQN